MRQPNDAETVVPQTYPPTMRSSTTLASRPDFAITSVACRDDHTGWSEPESNDDYRIVLVRRGRFRRKADGVIADVDPTLAYLGVPGEEDRFAHPSVGDDCTSVSLPAPTWALLAGDGSRPTRPTVYVDARLDLAHRRFLTAAAQPDTDYALTEALLGLVATTVSQTVMTPTPAEPARRKNSHLVARARAAIADDHPAAAGLFPLADLLGVSPYRLSRAFPQALGVSLTHYRNRVRVGRALDRLEQGERQLGRLAADLGFSDQAHLTRTIRAHVDDTPASLRRLLA